MLDEAALRDGLERLGGAIPEAERRLVESILRDGDDAALFRVNPLRVAASQGMDETAVIDAFVHAAHAGLFAMTWHLLCPVCGDVVQSLGSLSGVGSSYHCDLCQADFDTALDDYVEVSFTASPRVRPIRFHDPGSLTVEERYFQCEFHPGAVSARGVRLAAWFREHARVLTYLDPGATHRQDLSLTEGYLEGCDRDNHAGFLFRVAGRARRRAPHPLHLVLRDEGFEPREGEIPVGPVSLHVDNRASRRAALIAIHLPEDDLPAALPTYDPYLSGRRLVTSRAFRSLHHNDLVRDEGLRIKEVTLLFGDQSGSVGLTTRLGDLGAYALVREQYGLAAKLAAQHGGALVKTIGDATMLAFDDPRRALLVGFAYQEGVRELGAARGLPELALRVGIHCGPCILVSLEGRLDFFGQSVNLAARLQEAADPGEICLSAAAAAHAGVAALLPAGARPERIDVPGLGPQDVVRVRGNRGPAGDDAGGGAY